MAKMKNQVLGSVSGAVGDLVFRNRFRNNYIALRPTRFSTPMDERAVARRNKFKSALKLASALNSITPLKQLWSIKTTGNNTIFNRMHKAVYPTLVNLLPSEITALSPGKGFYVNMLNLELNSEQMRIVVDALGNDTGINTELEKTIRMVSVVALSSPSNSVYPDILYLPFESAAQTLQLNNQFDISFAFNDEQKELMTLYNAKRILAGLITFDLELQPVSISRTIYSQQ